MNSKVIFYSQKKIAPKQRTKFKKELAGHNDASHGGRYKYRIEGVLDKISYIKPSKGALILKKKDYLKIIQILDKYSIEYISYDINVPSSDFTK